MNDPRALRMMAIGVVAVLAWQALPGRLDSAPDVPLEIVEHGTTTLEALRGGRPMLITFWATDCAPCRKEVPHLKALWKRHRESGFQILAVAMSHDPPNRVWRFMQQHEIPYTVALDLDRRVAKAFGNVRATPTTFLVAEDGKIEFQHTGSLTADALNDKVAKLLDPASG